MQSAIERRRTQRLLDRFKLLDKSDPRLFDERGLQALETTLRAIVLTDAAMKRIGASETARRGRQIAERSCVTIRLAIPDFEDVKLLAEDVFGLDWVRGAKLPGSLAVLASRHKRLFQKLQSSKGDLATHFRLIVRLIQLELIWLGQVW